MNRAQELATILIEGEHDEHVKAHKLVQHWDKAHKTYIELAVKKREAEGVFRELGQAIGLERALVNNGLTRKQVSHYITGEQVGATHNYKRETPILTCKNMWCDQRDRPQQEGQKDCPECQEPLQTIMRRTPPSELRGKLARHIVGVETIDGKKVWFQEPVPPRHHDFGAEPIRPKPTGPQSEAEKRLGKWW